MMKWFTDRFSFLAHPMPTTDEEALRLQRIELEQKIGRLRKLRELASTEGGRILQEAFENDLLDCERSAVWACTSWEQFCELRGQYKYLKTILGQINDSETMMLQAQNELSALTEMEY